ncbi:MAG: phosphodiester glycosidase family protein [Bacillota bacterium]|nr:phosphodiester glycosidase family protein [Bacillota bacterium]
MATNSFDSNDDKTGTRNNKKLKNRKLKRIRLLIFFIFFELIFSAVSAPIIVFYGPFTNLKKIVIGTAMSTKSHQFIAKLFLSDKSINDILNGGDVPASNAISQKLDAINLGKHDNTITVKQVKGRKFSGKLMIVNDPTRVRVGYSSKLGVQGEKTSQIAKEYGAIAAINGGGFYDKAQNSSVIWTGTGAFPTGVIMKDGKLVFPKEAIDSKADLDGDVAAIRKDGMLIVGKHSLDFLKNNNVRDAITFGPTLIVDGVPQTRDSKGNNINNQGAQPRTAIGQTKDGKILLLVIDGRQGFQAGATIKDVQDTMMQEGAYNAVNLDGGASTTMYYNGKVINSPCDKYGERTIPTIIYVK